jgi:hypothetical protein
MNETTNLLTAMLKPVALGGLLFCGVSEEQFAINGTRYQWPKGSELGWNIGFSRLGKLGDQDLKDAYAAGCAEIMAATAGIKLKYVANPKTANILCNIARLDGPSGILADMQIPVGNVSDQATTLQGRFDDSELWVLSDTPAPNEIDFYRVGLHELLHAMGLGHKPPEIQDEALIAPIYNRAIRHLQPADKRELVIRYGEAAEVKPSDPPVPVAPGSKPVWVRIENGQLKVGQDTKEWGIPLPGFAGKVEATLPRTK